MNFKGLESKRPWLHPDTQLGPQENHEKPQPEEPTFRPRFEQYLTKIPQLLMDNNMRAVDEKYGRITQLYVSICVQLV